MIPTQSLLLAGIRRCLLRHVSVVVLVFAFASGSAFAATGDQSEFERALEKAFPGSYMLYASLSSDAQDQVFKEYKRNARDPGIARFSKVISKILELVIKEEQGSPAHTDHQGHSS